MAVVLRVPAPLRRLTQGAETLELNGATLRECLKEADQRFPGFWERLVDDSGALRPFINVFVNGDDVRFLRELDTETRPGDEITIVPAVAGG